MSIYSIPTLTCGTIAILLGSFVLIKRPKSSINFSFFLFCLSTFLWLLSYTITYSITDTKTAITCARIACTSVVFFGTTFYHFVVSYLDETKEFKYVFCAYVITFLMVPFFLFTDLFLSGVYKYYFGFYSKAGYLHPISLVFFFGLFIRGFFLLLFRLIKPKNTDTAEFTVQLKYMFAAFLIALVAAIDFIPKYGLEFYPFGFIFTMLFLLVTSYAILKHQVMGIEIFIRKTVIFTGLFIVSYGIIVFFMFLWQNIFESTFKLNKWVSMVPSIVVIILILRPFEDFLINITNKFLFQKKYDYKHMIRQFMDEIRAMALNVNEITESTIKFLDETLPTTVSGIFVYNKFIDQYEYIAGRNFIKTLHRVKGTDHIIQTLMDKNKTLISKNFSSPSFALMPFSGRGVELVIPLFLHKELIGFVCFGKKKSDEDYTKEDIEVLEDLCGALSIGLNNAMLFDEKAENEKRALVGTIATGINHEVGNPLNTMRLKLDGFRVLSRVGALKDKTKEEIIKDVTDMATICISCIERIAGITMQVSEFAKPEKELALNEVDIILALDETFVLLDHGQILDLSKVRRQVPEFGVFVRADKGQMQQIFFNLLKNASQAIDPVTGKINVTIEVKTPGNVVVTVQDNGKGIPERNLKKLFTPFFTTKEPGKGTGLGLALVKIMVERNNGRIQIDSAEGKGTTITLYFKGGFHG